MNTRTCDGCAKCCEGWLSGEVNNHAFFRGRPCFYLNKTCSIYDSRPDTPCRSFRCSWLAEDTFPHWMKPDLVNVIITKKKVNDIFYYEAVEAGSTLDVKTLSWLVHWAINTGNNLLYYLDNGINKIGSNEFLELKHESK